MTPNELIEALNREGVLITILPGDMIQMEPIPPDTLLDEVRRQKPEIIEILEKRQWLEVFSTAARLIGALPEGSPEYVELVRAYDESPDNAYPMHLARVVVDVHRRVDLGCQTRKVA